VFKRAMLRKYKNALQTIILYALMSAL